MSASRVCQAPGGRWWSSDRRCRALSVFILSGGLAASEDGLWAASSPCTSSARVPRAGCWKRDPCSPHAPRLPFSLQLPAAPLASRPERLLWVTAGRLRSAARGGRRCHRAPHTQAGAARAAALPPSAVRPSVRAEPPLTSPRRLTDHGRPAPALTVHLWGVAVPCARAGQERNLRRHQEVLSVRGSLSRPTQGRVLPRVLVPPA